MKELKGKVEISDDAQVVTNGDPVSMSSSRHNKDNDSDGLEDGEVEENSKMEQPCTKKVRRESIDSQASS